MRRFPLPPDWDGGPRCALHGKDAKRLSSVLRLGPGDRFPAMGRDGSAYECEVESVGRGEAVLLVEAAGSGGSSAGGRSATSAAVSAAAAELGEPVRYAPMPDVRAGRSGRSRGGARHGGAVPSDPTHARVAGAEPAHELPMLVLAVAVLKGSSLDEVARSAAEAGVAEIIPLITSRSVRAEAAGGRIERLRRVVAEALSQSGSGIATVVAEPIRLADLAGSRLPPRESRLCLFFHESPLAHGSLHSYCSGAPREIVACVGPEGGFDDAETAGLIEAGYLPAWLGPTVLRAGTAAIFAVAALRAICLERSSWSTVE